MRIFRNTIIFKSNYAQLNNSDTSRLEIEYIMCVEIGPEFSFDFFALNIKFETNGRVFQHSKFRIEIGISMKILSTKIGLHFEKCYWKSLKLLRQKFKGMSLKSNRRFLHPCVTLEFKGKLFSFTYNMYR